MINSTIEDTYRGKAKTLEYIDNNTVKIIFRDDISAGDGLKTANLSNKGNINAKLSNHLFQIISQGGIPTHLLKILSKNSIIARRLTIFAIEVVVRNYAAGSYCRRYGLKEGIKLDQPIIEFFVKNDTLHDPLIDGNVAIKEKYIAKSQLSLLIARSKQINNILFDYFDQAGLILIDFKLEFGFDNNGEIYLADELSADSMRAWDKISLEKLDKDRFRKDLGDVLYGYNIIYQKLMNTEYIPNKQKLGVKIKIKPKPLVTDPRGEITHRSLVKFGIDNIKEVRINKEIDILLGDTSDQDWYNKINQAAIEFLTNPLIEDYELQFY